MRLTIFVPLTLFVSALSARPSTGDALAIPAAEVRPEWTNIPQGDRVLPRIETTETLDGAKRREILYGPWTLRAGGMLSKYQFRAQPPCRNCFVTAIQYTSRYENGSEIQTSDGIWMHHCVMSSNTRRTSMTPLGPQILWAGGNERPTLRLNTRYRYGIYWPADFSFTVELMSSVARDVRVRPAITFEYIEEKPAKALGYRDSYLIWNSVGTPRYENGSYSLSSRSRQWTVPRSGVLLHAMGHMHDGGTHVDLYINDRMVCSSRMYYNARPGYGSDQMAHGRPGWQIANPSSHENFGGKHISDPGHCTSFGRVKEGDRMHILAYYNTKEYNVMSHSGKMEEQMGILRVFIGPD